MTAEGLAFYNLVMTGVLTSNDGGAWRRTLAFDLSGSVLESCSETLKGHSGDVKRLPRLFFIGFRRFTQVSGFQLGKGLLRRRNVSCRARDLTKRYSQQGFKRQEAPRQLNVVSVEWMLGHAWSPVGGVAPATVAKGERSDND